MPVQLGKRRDPTKKKARSDVVMSIEQKLLLIQYVRHHPGLTRDVIAKWASREFKLSRDPSTTTISRIMLSADEFVAKQVMDPTNAKMKYRRKVTSKELDEKLREWLLEVQARGDIVPDDAIKDKGREIFEQLKQENAGKHKLRELQFSNGWLDSFKKRHGFAPHQRSMSEVGDDAPDANAVANQLLVTQVQDQEQEEEGQGHEQVQRDAEPERPADEVVSPCASPNAGLPEQPPPTAVVAKVNEEDDDRPSYRERRKTYADALFCLSYETDQDDEMIAALAILKKKLDRCRSKLSASPKTDAIIMCTE